MAFSEAAPRAPDPAPDVDVLVVGAGITGIYQLHRALEEGFSALLLEAGGGVGGTWVWNRHPRPPAPPAPASTRRATPTATSSRRNCSTTGSGRSTSPGNRRSSAISTTWSIAS